MKEECDLTISAPKSEQEATRSPVEELALPPLWGSVSQAFQQARLARLEARVRRLRRYAMSRPVASQQPVVILTAERVQSHHDAAGTPVFATVPRRLVVILFVIVVGALGGLMTSQLPPRTYGITAAEETAPPPEARELAAAPVTEATRTTVVTLEERLVMLRQQIDQHSDQLTNHSSALERVSHQSDTQQMQLTTLVDALSALSAQVQQVEQQLTTQATRVVAHEKQLARQATQLSQWRESTAVSPVSLLDHGHEGPPTLELLAPSTTSATGRRPNATPSDPASSAPTVSAPTVSVSQSTGQRPRRTITLPASLGAAGLRTSTGTTGGPQP